MIPNILTTIRLILVPVFAYFLVGCENYSMAAVVFVLSGITDIADGFIARKYNMISNFGKIYDPFVDKLMQITAVVSLAVVDLIPFWVIAVVAIKEITMIIIGGILYLNKVIVYSHWYGKAATVLFYAIIFIMILWRGISPEWTMTLVILMVAAMLCSAGAYLYDIICHYDEKRIN